MTLKKKLTNIREATPMYHKFGLLSLCDGYFGPLEFVGWMFSD